jgi:deazaflavin-dependent oxidoreductase (nitroreductase family)
MEAIIQRALATDRTVDITTTGRRSGLPRRIEMWFHNIDGEVYLTGLPGARDWFANLLADPRLTFHLKESVAADLPARAVVISDPTDRRRIITVAVRSYSRAALEERVAASPLVRIDFE